MANKVVQLKSGSDNIYIKEVTRYEEILALDEVSGYGSFKLGAKRVGDLIVFYANLYPNSSFPTGLEVKIGTLPSWAKPDSNRYWTISNQANDGTYLFEIKTDLSIQLYRTSASGAGSYVRTTCVYPSA